jgi:hypothetical protein
MSGNNILPNLTSLESWLGPQYTKEEQTVIELLKLITPAKIIKREERTLSPAEQRLFEMIEEKINQS